MGTGEPEFPELAACSASSPPRSSIVPTARGRSGGRTGRRLEADIAPAKAAMEKPGAEEWCIASPSPGQIARYLKNRHYKTEEEYVFALAEVMARGISGDRRGRLDPAARLSRPRHVLHGLSGNERRGISQNHREVNVEALNKAVEGPRGRSHAHARLLGLEAARITVTCALQEIADIVLTGRPQAVSFPAPIRVTSMNGRSGRTSSCRTARSSFPA